MNGKIFLLDKIKINGEQKDCKISLEKELDIFSINDSFPLIKNNKVIDNFSHLVKPDALINKFISNLTGITNAMLKNKDKINTVLPLFMKFINKNLLVGHNVNFDINFIYDKLEKLRMKPLSNNFIDTLRLSRQIHKELNHHRLVDMAEYYKISLDGHHRAYHDCLIILSLLNNLRTDIINKYGNIENFKLETNHISSMFYNCYFLTSLDLSKFETGSVKNMSKLF